MSGMRSIQSFYEIHVDPIHAGLERASEVQKCFFPQRLPAIEGLDYYGTCRSAEQVGGDFFDFITTDDSVLTLSIGDVSGKGPSAALIMAGLQASLRALTAGGQEPLAAIMARLSRLLSGIAPSNLYATMFLSHIDMARHELRYVSAGHEPVLLVRDKARILMPLESTGPALGAIGAAEHRESTVMLRPGDTLVAATDGVSEAVEATDSESYEDLVIDVLRRHRRASSKDLANSILHQVESLHSMACDDDRTVVVVRSLMQEELAGREHRREAELIACAAVAQ